MSKLGLKRAGTQVSYETLWEYMHSNYHFTGRKAFKQLIKEAGVKLVIHDTGRKHFLRYGRFSPTSVRKILAYYHMKQGQKEIRKRTRARRTVADQNP